MCCCFIQLTLLSCTMWKKIGLAERESAHPNHCPYTRCLLTTHCRQLFEHDITVTSDTLMIYCRDQLLHGQLIPQVLSCLYCVMIAHYYDRFRIVRDANTTRDVISVAPFLTL